MPSPCTYTARVLGPVLCGLTALALTPRHAAAEVWNAEPFDDLTADSKASGGELKPLRLAAPRGGFVSGQVVVSGAAAGPRVEVSDLQGPAGTLPKSAVQVRYPTRRRDLTGIGAFDFGLSPRFDALFEKPLPGDGLQPVWLTVTVPADAAPGLYRGQVAVEGRKVPVELTVCAFKMPAAKDRLLVASVLQSSDTVAMRYGVTPYSDAHFKLLEPSLALQGRAGNNLLYVPVIGRTYFGNRNGLVQFKRNGADLVPDFGAFERYLELYLKHCGPPKAVVVYLWDLYLSEKRAKDSDPKLEITLSDGAGKLETLAVPNYPANKAIWKAVLDGLAARLAKCGVSRVQMLIGQGCDSHPSKETVDMFKEIAPDLKWTAWTHGYGYNGKCGQNGNEVGMWEVPDFTPPQVKFRGGWNEPVLRLNSLRCWVDGPLLRWRITPDLSAGRHKQGVCRGFGKLGLDYWMLPPGGAATDGKRKPQAYTLWAGPYPGLHYCRLDRGQPGSLTVAGPAGALSTERLELLAEGVQEAEARCCIEQAVAAKRSDDKQAGEVLLARYAEIPTSRSKDLGSGPISAGEHWQENLARIYNLAGEAQKGAGR